MDSKSNSKKTVLIIDDDTVLLNMYKQKIISSGYNVVTSIDGEEAFDVFQKEDVDLIICDIMLPRVSGIEFLEKIRKTKKGKNLPVIAWTNLKDTEVKEKAMKLSVKEFLIKGSLTLDQVVETVKKYLP